MAALVVSQFDIFDVIYFFHCHTHRKIEKIEVEGFLNTKIGYSWRKFLIGVISLAFTIMAWRSHGVNNADMINNLRSKNVV